MAWDTSASAAVAAVVVACIALLITSAQMLQQYLVTGQLIRLCDSVVFGPLPGQGRRIWQLSQFRFRVVYSIPQISLDTKLWPMQPPHTPSYAIGRHELPPLRRRTQKYEEIRITVVDAAAGSLASSTSSYWMAKLSRSRRLWNALRRRFPRRPDDEAAERRSSDQPVGEAAWVSFCRAIEGPCGASVRFDFMEYDADRCPPDLVTAPMQVSMRDVVIMSLMAGMEITSCSFERRSVSMQGHVGTMTSSNHPVLGPILHFTPRTTEDVSFGALGVRRPSDGGNIEVRWMGRTWDVCMVAGRYFHSGKRRTTRRLDERWIRERAAAFGDLFFPSGGGRRQPKGPKRGMGMAVNVKNDQDHLPPRPSDGIGSDGPKGPKRDIQGEENAEDDQGRHSPPRPSSGIESDGPRRYAQDGEWVITKSGAAEKERGEGSQDKKSNRGQAEVKESPDHDDDLQTSIPEVSASQGAEASRLHRRATVEDTLDEDAERRSVISDQGPIVEEKAPIVNMQLEARKETAKTRQALRSAKVQEIEKDKRLVEESIQRGAMISPYKPIQRLLITDKPHNAMTNKADLLNDPNSSDNDDEKKKPQSTSAEEEARSREEERQRLRRQRDDEREKRNKFRFDAVHMTKVDPFWICQMDIFQGFWATPWHGDIPLQSDCVGAISVILEALLGFLDETSLIYTGSSSVRYDDRYGYPARPSPNFSSLLSFRTTARWMFQGKSSYPAYAQNARGGVIAQGTYTGVRISAFTEDIPALELLYSYEWQVSPDLHDRARYGEEQNVEIMRLDAWLSYVGRLSEISTGRNNLLKQTPSLIALLVPEFELDFRNIDLSAEEGGLQDIQGLAANVMDFLTDEELSDAEQLYVLVALLRTVKVCQCVLAGPSTKAVREILLQDIQVHLV